MSVRAPSRSGVPVMGTPASPATERQKLCLITVPGLDVPVDWRLVHDRLLDQFADVTDVLATTMAGTILIVYDGPADTGAWLDTISETIVNFRDALRAHA